MYSGVDGPSAIFHRAAHVGQDLGPQPQPHQFDGVSWAWSLTIGVVTSMNSTPKASRARAISTLSSAGEVGAGKLLTFPQGGIDDGPRMRGNQRRVDGVGVGGRGGHHGSWVSLPRILDVHLMNVKFVGQMIFN